MSDRPNAIASTNNFEFAALALAENYRRTLLREFGAALRGAVLEVGAGIGQMTAPLVELPRVSRVLAVEPDPAFCARHRATFPKHEVLQGTAVDIPPGASWDAILSVNVLEHIADDDDELQRYAALLRARSGALCLFVPARPEIYAPIDKDFGHFRRYTRPGLRHQLQAAGFLVERLHYFNSLGYFAWWTNFCLLKKRAFEPAKVRFFDRVLFPMVNFLESRVVRPPFGQSLMAIARAQDAAPRRATA